MKATREIIKLREFVLPYYEKNDDIHQIDHADTVVREIAYLGSVAGIHIKQTIMAMYAGYLHDVMVSVNRDNHHLLAHDFVITEDINALAGVSNENRILIAMACREHRASGEGKYTSIVSELVACADRGRPDYNLIRKRGIRYYTELGFEGEDLERELNLRIPEKWGRNGYAIYPDLYKKVYASELERMWQIMDNL